jgi:G3E family GTPase
VTTDGAGHRTQAILVSGFAGAGKTTLIASLLAHAPVDERAVVVANDPGAVRLDRTALSPRLVCVAEVTGGCICCDAASRFHETVAEVLDRHRPHRLIVEVAGTAEPARILSAFFSAEPLAGRLAVEPSVCVVNAAQFHALARRHSFRYLGQIKSSDLVVLNHADACDVSTLDAVRRNIEALNPRAWIQEAVRGQVPPELLVLRGPWDAGAAALASSEPDSPGYSRFSYVEQGMTMDRGRLERMLKRLPRDLFRLKGFVRTEEGTYQLDYVTGFYDFEPAPAADPCSLVFVGRRLNKGRLLTLLERCKL